jgi:hypothetical protein
MVIGPCTEVLAAVVTPGSIARVVRPLFIRPKAVLFAEAEERVSIDRARGDLQEHR